MGSKQTEGEKPEGAFGVLDLPHPPTQAHEEPHGVHGQLIFLCALSCRPAAPLAAPRRRVVVVRAANKISVTKPSPEKLSEMKRCPTWGCGVSKFPWTYGETETAYVLEGEVIVTPNGAERFLTFATGPQPPPTHQCALCKPFPMHSGGEPVEIKAGDLAVFPEGMSCTWDVKKPINKHYKFS